MLITILVALAACNESSDEIPGPSVLYYSCEGDIVIKATRRTGQNCQISIYDRKELVTGRQLLRKDSAGWNFIGGDISATLSDTSIRVELRGKVYEGCTVDAQEKRRREYSDTIYYITNTGALLKVTPGQDSIDISMSYALNTLYSGSLPRVASASGEKYEDGNTMFWSSSNTAMFIHQGINYSHSIRMWPDEIAADPCSDTDLDQMVKAFLSRELSSDLQNIPEEDRKYYAERIDLNDDGRDEVLIAMRSPTFCGTGGCTWYIAGPDTSLLSRITASQFPVYISNETSEGYRDLYVSSRNKFHTLTYQDGRYPGNPSVEPEIRLFSDPAYTSAGTNRALSQAYLKSCPF